MEQNSKVVITREMVYDATKNACLQNGLEDAFFQQLWEAFLENDDIYKEYVLYLVKQDFPCEAVVCGYTIVDILVWQIDRFKARLDMDTTSTKRNRTSMVLLAFDTFMKLRKDPDKYKRHLEEDTGIENWRK